MRCIIKSILVTVVTMVVTGFGLLYGLYGYCMIADKIKKKRYCKVNNVREKE